MSKPWDPDALFIKAKLFLNHAMDDDSRQFDEQALWASLALELLAKAALAKVSPVLMTAPRGVVGFGMTARLRDCGGHRRDS